MWRNQDVGYYKYATAGIEFTITFGFCLVLGYLLDRWLKTLPVFTLAGAALGFAGAMYRLIVFARQASRKIDDRHGDEH